MKVTSRKKLTLKTVTDLAKTLESAQIEMKLMEIRTLMEVRTFTIFFRTFLGHPYHLQFRGIFSFSHVSLLFYYVASNVGILFI